LKTSPILLEAGGPSCHSRLKLSTIGGMNGRGLVLLPEGQPLGNNLNIIRYGDPTAQYPNGYFRYYNGALPNGQALVPSTGLPGSNAATHIPPTYQGPLIGYPGR
jgi:hypothetical protein